MAKQFNLVITAKLTCTVVNYKHTAGEVLEVDGFLTDFLL